MQYYLLHTFHCSLYVLVSFLIETYEKTLFRNILTPLHVLTVNTDSHRSPVRPSIVSSSACVGALISRPGIPYGECTVLLLGESSLVEFDLRAILLPRDLGLGITVGLALQGESISGNDACLTVCFEDSGSDWSREKT